MKVRVLLFASLKEAAGLSEGVVDLPQGATVEDVWSGLVAEHPGLAPHRTALAFAVNGTYSRVGEPVAEGDEVAFLPPVSGG